MTQVDEIVPSLGDAIDGFKADLKKFQREWSGLMMYQYPDRSWLNLQAKRLRGELKSQGTEINVLCDDQQFTIAANPKKPGIAVPCDDSLCIVTVHEGKPLAIDDVKHNPLFADHIAANYVTSWASAPIFVNGVAAGTVCAVERDRPRDWNLRNQEVMVAYAKVIGLRIEDWLGVSKAG